MVDAGPKRSNGFENWSLHLACCKLVMEERSLCNSAEEANWGQVGDWGGGQKKNGTDKQGNKERCVCVCVCERERESLVDHS